MAFVISVNTTFDGATPVILAPSPDRYAQLSFANPDNPDLAELHRLFQERWHTRPDWWIRGDTPKNIQSNFAALPSEWQAAWDAGNNRFVINTAVPGLDGWNFADFGQPGIYVENGGDIEFLRNMKIAPSAVTRSERLTYVAPRPRIEFRQGHSGRIRMLERSWFTAAPGHEGGGFWPQAHMAAFPENSGVFPRLDEMRYNSFEAYGTDALKGAWGGTQRGNVFDAPYTLPDDATEWNASTVYNQGDMVWPPTNITARVDWPRICRVNGTVGTQPNWSGASNTSALDTANWKVNDPHADINQAPATPNEVLPMIGNVFVFNQNRRRYPSRKQGIGYTTILRLIPNGAGSNEKHGSYQVRKCLFTEEIEALYQSTYRNALPSPAQMQPGAAILFDGNWVQGTGAFVQPNSNITETNTTFGHSFPGAATVSGITALHGRTTDTLAYEFTASSGGWMTVVVSTSATAMTAAQIVSAKVGGAILARFEIDAEAGRTALGFTPLTLTTGQTVYAHALYQAGGGIDTLAPVRTVTEGSGVNNALSLTEMDFDGYVFDRNGSDKAPVILSGQGRAGNQVQVRGTSAGGTTAWLSTFVRSDGTWQATMPVPQSQWGNWYRPEARYGTNDGTRLTGTNTFGCGDVLAVLGQSELHYWLDNDSYYNANFTRAIDAENLTVILHDEDDNPSPVTTARISSGTVSSANVGCLAVANALNHIRPNRKLMLIDLAHSGTSPFALWNDATASRQWSELMDMVNKARASGSDIGGVILNWYNAPASSMPTMLQDWAPGMFGQKASGAAFTLGSSNNEGSAYTGVIDHCFWDIAAAPDDRGRGIFARNRTKLHLMLPMPFNDITSGTEAAGFPENQRMNSAARAGILTFAADSRVQSFLAAVGPGTHLADFDEGNTGTSLGIHPNVSDPLGVPWFANQHLPAVLRQAGVAVGEPKITGIQVVNATTVDVIVDLPNGGNLTTLAALLGIANPASRPDHHQAVTGFQITRGGDKRAIRRSGTGYAANWTGTVTIQDTGTGTAPNRTGRVRIVLDTAIASGDRLTWLDGQANAGLDVGDEAAKLFRWMLMETVPAWRNTGALHPFHGIPVRPQTTMPAM